MTYVYKKLRKRFKLCMYPNFEATFVNFKEKQKHMIPTC